MLMALNAQRARRLASSALSFPCSSPTTLLVSLMAKSLLPESLLLGTRNPGKLREITSILHDVGWSFCSLQEFPDIEVAEENGETFAENAIAKARFYATAAGLWVLADDSGLEVVALGGAPGVFSARYAGDNASDANRRELLLSELAKTGNTNRSARFAAVVAISDNNGHILNVSEGICEGTLTFA